MQGKGLWAGKSYYFDLQTEQVEEVQSLSRR